MRWSILLFAVCAGPVPAANLDGVPDPSFGDGGRTAIGYLQSDHVGARAIVKGTPAQGEGLRIFDEDRDDPATVYVAKFLNDGDPDPNFGPSSDGRRLSGLPAGLIPQTEAVDLDGAILQLDRKPIVFGGLRAIGANTGVFLAFVCRLNVAGQLDDNYGISGIRKPQESA